MKPKVWKVKEQPWFADKPYKDGILEIERQTCVRSADFDERAIKLLDYLHDNGGRGNAACQFLLDAVKDRSRDKVSNWKGYLYTLVRSFDESAYTLLKRGKKTRDADRKSQSVSKPFVFNVEATTFVPGLIDLSTYMDERGVIINTAPAPEVQTCGGDEQKDDGTNNVANVDCQQAKCANSACRNLDSIDNSDEGSKDNFTRYTSVGSGTSTAASSQAIPIQSNNLAVAVQVSSGSNTCSCDSDVAATPLLGSIRDEQKCLSATREPTLLQTANSIKIKKISRPAQGRAAKSEDVAKIMERAKKVQERSQKSLPHMAATGRELLWCGLS